MENNELYNRSSTGKRICIRTFRVTEFEMTNAQWKLWQDQIWYCTIETMRDINSFSKEEIRKAAIEERLHKNRVALGFYGSYNYHIKDAG